MIRELYELLTSKLLTTNGKTSLNYRLNFKCSVRISKRTLGKKPNRTCLDFGLWLLYSKINLNCERKSDDRFEMRTEL